jgi:4-amino-4-deoxy-L-arabinose transferase-like glycosyltransferase
MKKSVFFIIAFMTLYVVFSFLVLKELDQSFFSKNLALDEATYVEKALTLSRGEMPQKAFYQAPLYPFILSGLFQVTGFSVNSARYFHILCGVVTLALLFSIARRLWGSSCAYLSALLFVFSGIFYFYQGLILKESVMLLFCMLFIYFFLLYLDDLRSRNLLFSAVSFSLLSLVRENAIMLLLVPLVLVAASPQPLKKKTAHGLCFLIVFLVFLAPFSYFNSKASGRFILTSAQAGQNFYIGNNPKSFGRYTEVRGVRSNPSFQEDDFAKIARDPSAPPHADSYWFKKAFHSISGDKAGFLKLLFMKAMLFINDYEIPNNRNFYFERNFYAPLLYFFPISFGMIFPFALLGIFSGFRKMDLKYLFIVLNLAVYSASVILFYVLSRYRLLVWPLVIILSAKGLTHYAAYLREGRIKRWFLATGLLVFLFAVTFHVLEIEGTLKPFPTFSRNELHIKEFSYVLYNMGVIMNSKGRYDEAREIFESLVQINPAYTKAYHILALISEKLKDFPEMIRYYDIIMKNDKSLMTADDYEAYRKHQ